MRFEQGGIFNSEIRAIRLGNYLNIEPITGIVVNLLMSVNIFETETDFLYKYIYIHIYIYNLYGTSQYCQIIKWSKKHNVYICYSLYNIYIILYIPTDLWTDPGKGDRSFGGNFGKAKL